MRKMIVFWLFLFFSVVSVAAPGRGVTESATQERTNWEKYFRDANVEGSFLLYNLKKDAYSGCNLKRTETPYIPASTYKIFNSLVALEIGVIKDENEVIKWDGVDRGIADWNQDQTLRSAIKYSAVWFYQELARRIGQLRMQRYVDLAGYGNRDISGGIDRFWLDGNLRITSREQIGLLVRLYQKKLPFSRRTQEIVNDILINEKTDAYVLRAKTGLALAVTPETGRLAAPSEPGGAEPGVGWWVGYVERDGDAYFFATNIAIVHAEDRDARKSVTKNILRELKLIE